MSKAVNTSGKRKSAVARVTVKPGKGLVKVNNLVLQSYEPRISRLKIQEPIIIAGAAAKNLDINVRVNGGGFSSQAEAARLAIAQALVAHSKSKELKKALLEYDRNMLVADVRRKEPSKPNRHGQARAKRQKSYR